MNHSCPYLKWIFPLVREIPSHPEPPTWECCSCNSAPSFLHHKSFTISWDILLNSQACCRFSHLKKFNLSRLNPPTIAPSLCNNYPLKSCLYTLCPSLLPFFLQHTPGMISLPSLHWNCSFKVTNVLTVAKANHQFSDFMLFDLSFDIVDYLVHHSLVSLGFQATILSWFSSHFIYMLLLRLHCLFLLLSENVNVEGSQDSVFGPIFFSLDNLIMSHSF